MNDLKFAFRQLPKNPGFTAVAVLTLALGIGANTALFSAVDAVLIRPLPYADAGRLVMIWDEMSHIGFPKHSSTPAEWHEWRRHNTGFTLQQARDSMAALSLRVAAAVLLISCVNLANLLMSRWAARRGEVAVRAALGAGRGRLILQFLVESLVLAGFGAIAGLVLAIPVMQFLEWLVPETMAGVR